MIGSIITNCNTYSDCDAYEFCNNSDDQGKNGYCTSCSEVDISDCEQIPDHVCCGGAVRVESTESKDEENFSSTWFILIFGLLLVSLVVGCLILKNRLQEESITENIKFLKKE
eukprot:UN31028